MPMELSDLKYYIEVVRAGSFTEAGRRNGVSEQRLSACISRLNASCGVTLIARKNRRLVPTEAGLRYYDAAKRIMNLYEMMQQDLDRIRSHDGDRIRALCTRSNLAMVREQFPGIYGSYPGITLQLSEARTLEILSALRSGSCELGIFSSMTEELPPELTNIVLEKTELFMGFTRDDPLAHPVADPSEIPAADLADLNGRRFIYPEPETAIGQYVRSYFREKQVEPIISLVTSDRDIIPPMLEAIKAVCFVAYDPALPINYLRLPDPMYHYLHLAYRKDADSPAMRQLVSGILQGFSSLRQTL